MTGFKEREHHASNNIGGVMGTATSGRLLGLKGWRKANKINDELLVELVIIGL